MITVNSNIAFALDSKGFIKETYQYEPVDSTNVRVLTGLNPGDLSEVWEIHPKSNYIFTQPNGQLKPQFVNNEWVETATDEELGISLSQVQQRKIDQIRDMYNQTLASGFTVSLAGTSYTFGWTTDDMTHMNATQTAVGKGFLTFPILYADVKGNPVSIPDQTTLDLIEETATKFMMAQHQQGLQLVGQVQQATSVSAVNAINWSASTY